MSAPRQERLPAWAAELATLYESGAANGFVLCGNLEDRFLLPGSTGDAGKEEAGERGGDDRRGGRLVAIEEFLSATLLGGFDIVLTYDLGNGVRVLKGRQRFAEWPYLGEIGSLPRRPHDAVAALTRYFRYTANLRRLGRGSPQVACLVREAQLAAPAPPAGGYDANAVALLLREWASDPHLTDQPLAAFFLSENKNDLHPLVCEHPRIPVVEVPLPDAGELTRGLEHLAQRHPRALGRLADDLGAVAGELVGASLGAVETLLKVKEHRIRQGGGGTEAGESEGGLSADDLVTLKRRIVEDEAGGLIEFLQSSHTLEVYQSPPALKDWLRQDLELWRRGALKALPKGYLLCGPVGTGKTFLAECLAGEAGVPMVVLKNFRHKWVGTTEGNLEKIFRLLHALGRCFVFIDEADQTLGKRDAGSGDSGLSGRVYSMIAQEMASSANRGRIIWILASSRPDLIEVDLKRPGRIDCKIPLFPAATPEEGFRLLQALCRRYGIVLPDDELPRLADSIPDLLTPAAAEIVAFRAYRSLHTGGDGETGAAPSPGEAGAAAVAEQLVDYRHPVPRAVLEAQIQLAVAEATDLDLVPERFRHWAEGTSPGR